MTEVEQPPQNGIDLSAGDDDESSKARPADIEQDMREMERRKRVEAIMGSKLFREELERIVESAREGGASGIIQQLSDIVGMPASRVGSMFKSSNCLVPINDIRGIESMGYAKGEKILRCKLAAAFRLLDLNGWTQGLSAHITARLKVDKEYFLVNPYGLLFHEITASSLNKVDMQGNIIEQGTTNFGVNKSLFILHSAVHAARPDIRCAIYVGCSAVVAISSLKTGVLPITRDACLLGEITTHHYTGSLNEPEEQDKLVRNLGPNSKVLLLSNHGALCCGETIEEAFYAACNIVKACETQIKLIPIGIDNLVLIPEETRRIIYEQSRKPPEDLEKVFASALSTSDAPPTEEGTTKENQTVKIGAPKWRVGGAEFEALMRMLDNAGYRTGYIYRHPLIKSDPPKPKNDVELPPAVSSLGYLLEEEGMWKGRGDLRKGGDRSRWLNSPNVYQKVEVLETGTPDPKKITKWVAEGSPTHSTPVRIEDPLQFVPAGTNPKEFKRLQQQIKDNRRADKISAGPQSHILEGVTWDEANRIKDATVSQAGDHVVLMGAASKGIIQRGYQHNATVYKAPYAKNPFDNVTDDELNEYKRTVERKKKSIHGEYTDTDFSESEAISSLQTSGAQQTKQITTTTTAAVSQSEPEDVSEHHVMRIETQQAPVPSQPEVVLSDATLSFINGERSHTATNRKPPTGRDSQEFISVSGKYNQAAQIAEILELYEDSEKERVYHDCKNTQFKKSLLIMELKKNNFFKRQRCKTASNVLHNETAVTSRNNNNNILKVGSSNGTSHSFNIHNSRSRIRLPLNIQNNDTSSYYSDAESESLSSSQPMYDYVYNVADENSETADNKTSNVYYYINNDEEKLYKKSVSCNTPKVCETVFNTRKTQNQKNDLILNIPFIPICTTSTSSSSTPRYIQSGGSRSRRSSSSSALSPYRTLSHSGFMPAQRNPVPDHKHIPLPTEPMKYKPLGKSLSFEGIFASPRYIEVCEKCFENIFQEKILQDSISDALKSSNLNNSKNCNESATHCNTNAGNSSYLPEYESITSTSADVTENFASFSSQLEPLLEVEEIDSDRSDKKVVNANHQSNNSKEVLTVNPISKTSFIDKIMRFNYSEESTNSNFKKRNRTISSNISDMTPENNSKNEVTESTSKESVMEILEFGNCVQNNAIVSNTNILSKRDSDHKIFRNDKIHSPFSNKDYSKDQNAKYSMETIYNEVANPSDTKRMLMTREERIHRKLIFQDLWEDHIHFFQWKENDCDIVTTGNVLKDKDGLSVHQSRIETEKAHISKKTTNRTKSLCSYFEQRLHDEPLIEVGIMGNEHLQSDKDNSKTSIATTSDNDFNNEKGEIKNKTILEEVEHNEHNIKHLKNSSVNIEPNFPEKIEKNTAECLCLDHASVKVISQNDRQFALDHNNSDCSKNQTELVETENEEPIDMSQLAVDIPEGEETQPINISEVIDNVPEKCSQNVSKEQFLQYCNDNENEEVGELNPLKLTLAEEKVIEDINMQTENVTKSVFITPALVIEKCKKLIDDQSECRVELEQDKNCECEDNVKKVTPRIDIDIVSELTEKYIEDEKCESDAAMFDEYAQKSVDFVVESCHKFTTNTSKLIMKDDKRVKNNPENSIVEPCNKSTDNHSKLGTESDNNAEYQSVERTETVTQFVDNPDSLIVEPCIKFTSHDSKLRMERKNSSELKLIENTEMVSKFINNPDELIVQPCDKFTTNQSEQRSEGKNSSEFKLVENIEKVDNSDDMIVKFYDISSTDHSELGIDGDKNVQYQSVESTKILTETINNLDDSNVETCNKSTDDQSGIRMKEESSSESKLVKNIKVVSEFIDNLDDKIVQTCDKFTTDQSKPSMGEENSFELKLVKSNEIEGNKNVEDQSVESTKIITETINNPDDSNVEPCNKSADDQSGIKMKGENNSEFKLVENIEIVDNPDDMIVKFYDISSTDCAELGIEGDKNVKYQSMEKIKIDAEFINNSDSLMIDSSNKLTSDQSELRMEGGNSNKSDSFENINLITETVDDFFEKSKSKFEFAYEQNKNRKLIDCSNKTYDNVTSSTVVEFVSENGNNENLAVERPMCDEVTRDCNIDEEKKLIYRQNCDDKNKCNNEMYTEYEMFIMHDSETNSVDVDVQLTPSTGTINQNLSEKSTSLITNSEVYLQKKLFDSELEESKEEEKSIGKSQDLGLSSFETVLTKRTSELYEIENGKETDSIQVSENQSSSYHTAYSISGQEIDIGKEINGKDMKIDCPYVNQVPIRSYSKSSIECDIIENSIYSTGTVNFVDQTKIDKCEIEADDENAKENGGSKSDEQSNNSECSNSTYNVDEDNNRRLSFFREYELYSTTNINDLPKIDMHINNIDLIDAESVNTEIINNLSARARITDEQREIIHSQLKKHVKINSDAQQLKFTVTPTDCDVLHQDTEEPLTFNNSSDSQDISVPKIINSDVLNKETHFSLLELEILNKIETNNLKETGGIFEKIDSSIRNKWATSTLAELVNTQLDISSKSSSRLQDYSNSSEIDFTKKNFLSSTPSPSKCKILSKEDLGFITLSNYTNKKDKVDLDEKPSTSTPKTKTINRGTYVHRNCRRSRSFTAERSSPVAGALKVKMNKTVPYIRTIKNKPITTVHEMFESKRVKNQRNFVLENIRNAGIPRYLQKSCLRKAKSNNNGGTTLKKTSNTSEVPVTSDSTSGISQPSIFTFKSKESISGSPKFWFSLPAKNSVPNKKPQRLSNKAVSRIRKIQDPFELKPCESLTCIPTIASQYASTISNAVDDGTNINDEKHIFNKVSPYKRRVPSDEQVSASKAGVVDKKIRFDYNLDEDTSEEYGVELDKSPIVSEEDEKKN